MSGLILCMDYLTVGILTLQVCTFSLPIWKGETVASVHLTGYGLYSMSVGVLVFISTSFT